LVTSSEDFLVKVSSNIFPCLAICSSNFFNKCSRKAGFFHEKLVHCIKSLRFSYFANIKQKKINSYYSIVLELVIKKKPLWILPKNIFRYHEYVYIQLMDRYNISHLKNNINNILMIPKRSISFSWSRMRTKLCINFLPIKK